MGSPPPNNLVWAILVTLFCCLPFGIVSIVYAAQVNGKWQAGDAAGAQESSRKARQWAIYGAIAGGRHRRHLPHRRDRSVELLTEVAR
jgi:hypothetical protein